MSEKIKILHMMDRLEYGGIQSFIVNIYKEIDKNKIQFDFLVTGAGEYDELFKKTGSNIFFVPSFKNVGYFRYKRLLSLFFKSHPEYKIVHIHYSQLTSVIAKIARRNHVKVIISHSHSSDVQVRGMKAIVKKMLGNGICRYATDFFACSEKASKFLFRDKVKNVRIVKNGINVREYEFDIDKRNTIRRELGISEKTVVIGHVGRMVKAKNQLFLIDILKSLLGMNCDVSMLLVGDGPELTAIKKRVREKGVEDRIYFVGSKVNASDYYNAMDYFVFPSLSEGFGISLLEAQANGLKCFASDNVPKETNITGEITFIPLVCSAENWADCIISSKSERFHKNDVFEKYGYDIKSTAKSIQNEYLKMYDELKKAKVLQYVPSYAYGGIESFTYYINKGLRDKYGFVYVVENDVDDRDMKRLNELGARIIRIPNLTKDNLVSHIISILKLFKNNDFDVVHVHDCDIRFLVMMIAKVRGIKNRIYHIHSKEPSGSVVAKKIKKIGIKLNILFSSLCLTCSSDPAINKGVRKYTVIKNAIDIKKFKFSDSSRTKVRDRYNIADDSIVLLFVGRIEKVKNLIFLLKVMERLIGMTSQNCYLIVVGDGSELNNIVNNSVFYPTRKNVLFVGKKKNLRDYYSSADYLCLPSYSEGFPIVLLEAQANGLPCIVSNHVSSDVAINKNVEFLGIDADDVNKWVEYILANIDESRRRHENNLKISDKMKEYDYRCISDYLANIYERKT